MKLANIVMLLLALIRKRKPLATFGKYVRSSRIGRERKSMQLNAFQRHRSGRLNESQNLDTLIVRGKLRRMCMAHHSCWNFVVSTPPHRLAVRESRPPLAWTQWCSLHPSQPLSRMSASEWLTILTHQVRVPSYAFMRYLLQRPMLNFHEKRRDPWNCDNRS